MTTKTLQPIFAALALLVAQPADAGSALETALAEGATQLDADAIAARFAGKTVTFATPAGDKRFLIYYGEGNEMAGRMVGGNWADEGFYGITDGDRICLSWNRSDKPRLRCMTVVLEGGEVRKYGADGSYDGVIEKFGVPPESIPDYLGLVGDTIDNLPGVPGIGAKSAAAVLQTFERIDAVPEAVDDWDGLSVRGAKRMAERIAAHRGRALKTRALATVVRDVPGVKPALGELAYHGADRPRVEALFERLGWNRIYDRIPKWQP